MLLMNKDNCALKLVDEVILYYDAQSKKYQKQPCIISKVSQNLLRIYILPDGHCWVLSLEMFI